MGSEPVTGPLGPADILPRFGSGSLLGRVVAVFVAVLIISNIIVAVFEYNSDNDDLAALADEILAAEAAGVRVELVAAQDRRRAALADVVRSVDFTEAVMATDGRGLNQILAGLLDEPIFDFVGVILPDGSQVPAGGFDVPIVPEGLRDRLGAGVVLRDAGGRYALAVGPQAVDGTQLFGGIHLVNPTARALLRGVNVSGSVVLLVVGEQVVAATADITSQGDDATLPPGWTADGPPPVAVDLGGDGAQRLVTWVQVVAPVDGLGSPAWVGVLIDDPLQNLRVALLRNRALSIAMLASIGILLALIMLRLVTRPVSELTEAAERIADGDLDHDFRDVQGAAELEQLAGALDGMLGTLRSNTQTMARQADLLRSATERIVAARDDERRRMAATLHDGFQQRLVVLRMKLAALGAEPSQASRAEVSNDVQALLTDLRRLSHDLYPSILRDRGLAAGLHSLVGGQAADVGLELHPDPFPRLPLEIEANAYFLVAEGLTNALKHSPGVRVYVSARVFADELEVVVLDAGRGFDVEAQRGAGLTGFEDRAAAVGGTCLISSDHNGTWVVARVPLPKDDARPAITREGLERYWGELMEWDAYVQFEAAAGRRVIVTSTATLEEQQDGSHTTIEVRSVAESEFREDGVGVLLDGPLGDDE